MCVLWGFMLLWREGHRIVAELTVCWSQVIKKNTKLNIPSVTQQSILVE